MGAFIAYLHLAYGINNFFVLAPNLMIYDKLIGDFTPNKPKYVFKGIAEFVTNEPMVITGDDYDQRDVASASLLGIKPFMLVIARDTTHAGRLRELIESEAFHGGRYRGKVIQVDSSKTQRELVPTVHC